MARRSKSKKSKMGGLTQYGRDWYNAQGHHLQRPTPSGARHKSFCARSRGWHGKRGKLARKRWHC